MSGGLEFLLEKLVIHCTNARDVEQLCLSLVRDRRLVPLYMTCINASFIKA